MKRQRRSFSAEFKHKAACLVAVRGQGRFWRRERSSCKAGFGEMARTYILYVSVSSRIPTPQMRAQQAKKSPAFAGPFLLLEPVRGQGRFWRRERSESKAFLTAKARAYFSYASVSPAKITPLSRAQQPKKSPAIAGLSYFLNRCEARIVSGVASEARARHF